MKIRKEIRSLDANQVLKLREAWSNSMETNAYQDLVGLHGLPNPSECQHHRRQFLPWHRLYLLEMEAILEKEGYTDGIPYWDFTKHENTVNGFPEICTEETYVNRNNVEIRNPLKFGKIGTTQFAERRGSLSEADCDDNEKEETDALGVDHYWRISTRLGFAQRLESLHDNVHGQVGGPGGAMSSVALASYDPLFWFFHTNVDRQWAHWQIDHPTLPDSIANRLIPHYDVTIGSTLNYTQMGYTYESLQNVKTSPKLVLNESTSLFTADLSLLNAPDIMQTPRIELSIDGLRSTKETLFLRVFVNQQDAGPGSTLNGNPNYAGTITLLGMAEAHGPGMFMGEFEKVIDLGPALNRLNIAPSKAKVSFVCFDQYGETTSLAQHGISPRLRLNSRF